MLARCSISYFRKRSGNHELFRVDDNPLLFCVHPVRHGVFMHLAHGSGNRQAMIFVSQEVVTANLYFTTPSVIVQPLSGFTLMCMSGYSVQPTPLNWLGWSLMLYAVAGACWCGCCGCNGACIRLHMSIRPSWFCLQSLGNTSALRRRRACLLSLAWSWSLVDSDQAV